MKEISYEGPLFNRQENEWEKKQKSLEQKKGSEDIRPLRTYRNDVEELIQKQGTTPIQVAMAETARREQRGEPRVASDEKEGHLGWIIFTLLLILAFGIGVGLYVLVGVRMDIPLFETATTTQALPPETNDAVLIELSGAQKEQIIADISIAFGKTSLPEGSERAILFQVKKGEDSINASISDFFDSLFPFFDHITRRLSPTLDTAFQYHIRASKTSLSGVIRIPTRSHANTYATMLEWETTMGRDLVPVLNAWYDKTYLLGLDGRLFADEQVAGENARVLYDVTGRPVLAYSFANKKTLIIAGNRDALEEALLLLKETN